MTAARIGYRWHLRRLMAEKDMYATTQLGPLLAERGITLSREQVYRLADLHLVTQPPMGSPHGLRLTSKRSTPDLHTVAPA
jgi:hypothetical protein